MANELIIYPLNPVKFVNANPVMLPQYLTKHFDDFLYFDQLNPWDYKVRYCQKWQNSDTIPLQFYSDLNGLTVDTIDKYGQKFSSTPLVKVKEDLRAPGFWAQEANIILATLPEDGFYMEVRAAGVLLKVSEPQYIKPVQESTVLIEYTHSHTREGILFETGIIFKLRVECAIGRLNPGSADKFYTNQRYTPFLLDSKTFRDFPFSFGGTYGVPDWMIDKINLAAGCNNVKYDGKAFAKITETKFTFNTEGDDYPLRGLTLELREQQNTIVNQVKLFTAFWKWGTSNPAIIKGTLLSSLEPLQSWAKSGVFTDGGNVAADFSGAGPDQVLIIKVPAAQPVFTIWENDPVFNTGTIDDFTFGPSFLGFNGQFRFYMTKRKVTMNANFPVTLKR